MAYAPPVDWKNTPDHSTPLTAANIKAMEAALAAYSDTLVAARDSAYDNLEKRQLGLRASDVPGAATYIIRSMGVNETTSDVPTGVQAGLGIFAWDPARFAVAGKTLKLLIDCGAFVNATAPGRDFTIGLYPVTAVAGGLNALNVTLGAVVTTVPFLSAALVASAMLTGSSGDFTAPAAGFYAFGVAVSGAMTASSVVDMSLTLRKRLV